MNIELVTYMYEPEGVINVGKMALFNGILIDFLIIVQYCSSSTEVMHCGMALSIAEFGRRK